MPMLYRLWPVPCFEYSRLRLTAAGEEMLARVLLDVQMWPLFLDRDLSECLSRTFHVVFRRVPNSSRWLALVYDIPRPFVVRPVLVRDDIANREVFLRELEGHIVRTVQQARRALRT